MALVHLLCTLLSLLSVQFHTGDAFSFGAPAGTCWTMYPKHSGIHARKDASPFVISVNPDVYMPGEDITLTIADPNGRMFKGIQIGAHRTTDNTEEIVGQFVSFPGNKVRVFTCFGGYKNMVTHWNNDDVASIELTWRAPSENVGDIIFRATIVENYTMFWHGIEVDLLSSNKDPSSIVPSVYQALPTTSMYEDIDFEQCGETKGCFLYPRHCSDYDCVAAVLYTYQPQTDDFVIEMFTDAADNYISVAFSKDKHMGHHDETYTCVRRDGLMNVQHGFNPEYYNERQFTMFVSDMELRYADGRLECRFVIPRTSELYEVVQQASSFQYNATEIDKAEKWYIQLAWGDTKPGTDVIIEHIEMPAQTDSMVDLRIPQVVRGSAFHVLVQIHAAVMMIAWVFLAPILPIISRHFKDWMPKRRPCGTKVWFQIHREIALLVILLTAAGLAVVFAEYGSDIREISVPHSYVGLAVTAAVGVQVIAGFLRPGPDHKLRPLFNWGHRITGQITSILAAATMFLAFDIDYINKDMRLFGYIALGLWVLIQVVWALSFEILLCRKLRGKNSETYAINEPDKSMQIADGKETAKEATTETLMLAAYVICLAAVCVAALLAFLLY